MNDPTQPEGWYNIGLSRVKQMGGGGLLDHFQNSLPAALKVAWPKQQWLPWKFQESVPKQFWREPANQRDYFGWLGTELNIQTFYDWTRVDTKTVIRHNGRRIIRHQGDSVKKALQTAYPEAPWNLIYDPIDIQRRFMNEYSKIHGFTDLDSWYQVSAHHFIQSSKGIASHFNARTILQMNGNSLPKTLQNCYPSHKWIVGRFCRAPRFSWKDKNNVRDFIEYLQKELEISSGDWKRISRDQVDRLGGAQMLRVFGNLEKALKFAFPDEETGITRTHKKKKSEQRWLQITLQKIFPGKDILEDYQHPSLQWEHKKSMEIDLWIPDHNLAIEYQGEHHYHENLGVEAFGLENNENCTYSFRDSQKEASCKAAGINLVLVPYWWDGKQESLENILLSHDTQYPKTEKEHKQ
eukprot:TRINITY_DN6596_c0_g1_i1.p1 TRINITY_DN6596_c0_g1~~TRINITY_DN6596_c0_g1_i1.p1  ORF type:complete len:469 (+),score=66.18 TRINITY_DN6596_c0_g1_i1:181-1407(+)